MPYMLIGDSGTVIFETTGTVDSESVKFSSAVTKNPVQGGGSITDHAVLDPLKFDISGIVTSGEAYATLEAMWRNRDLLQYRGREAHDNLLITSFQRSISAGNDGGFGFKISFQQITIATAILVDIPTMSKQDSGTRKSAAAAVSSKTATTGGLIITNSEYVAYTQRFNSSNVNSSITLGRTNPSYAGVAL